MKKLIGIFCVLVVSRAVAGPGGNIGIIDDRRYGSLEDPTYSAVGRINIGCTAGFIEENIILTNHHCAEHCMTPGKCSVHFWNGQKYVDTPISPLNMPQSYQTFDGQDWAMYKTDAPNPNVKKIATHSSAGPISRGGFGLLRIIKNEELPILKKIYLETKDKYYDQCREQNPEASNAQRCFLKRYYDALSQAGIQPLNKDGKNFKIQECNIRGTHPKSTNMLATDCDSSGGDSGTPLLRGSEIVGLNNGGPQLLFSENENIGAIALKTENFYSSAQETISQIRQQKQSGSTQNVQITISQTQNNVPLVTTNEEFNNLMSSRLNDFQCDY